MGQRSSKEKPDPELGPEALVDYLLKEQTIAFKPCFAKLTKSATAGLMLSQAVHYQGLDNKYFKDGFFYKTQAEWEDTTCLTRREQESARKILGDFSFWMETSRPTPRALHVRCFKVDMTLLRRELLLYVQKRHFRMSESESLNPQNRQIEMRKTANISLTKTSAKRTCSPETSQDAMSVPVEEKASGSRIVLPKLEPVGVVQDGLAGGVHLTDMWNSIREGHLQKWPIEETVGLAARRAALTLCDNRRGQLMGINVDELAAAVTRRLAPLFQAFKAISELEDRVHKVGQYIENATISEARKVVSRLANEKQAVLKF